MDEEVATMIRDTVKESVETSRQTLLQEIGQLFDKISEQNNSSQVTRLSNLVQQDHQTFKKKSNEEQYKANSKVVFKLKEANASLEQRNTVEAQSKITEALDMLSCRQKLIKLADGSELGWRVVKEYESNPLAEDSEDEKKMHKAEARANQKIKTERTKKGKRPGPYGRVTANRHDTNGQVNIAPLQKPGLCFQCGKAGHWRKDCRGNQSYNKMSIKNDVNKTYLNDCSIYVCNVFVGYEKTAKGISGSENQALKSNCISPVGRLKAHADKWRSVTESTYIVDVVENGYKLPFKSYPTSTHLKNNKSARDNPLFVTDEIESLLGKGVITKVEKIPQVVNPLTVAYNKVGKPRMVLDCRHANKCIHLFKIKFEDIRVAQSIFRAGVFAFTYDLKGAYHHIDIAEVHKPYLGFCWKYYGKNSYFVFNSLPFGIASAGHIFTKVVRVVVTYLRSLGHKVVMFLDDGIGGHFKYDEALRSSNFVRDTFHEFGFLIAEEKCQWLPVKVVTWLGYVLDFSQSKVFITGERIAMIEKSIESLIFQLSTGRFKTVNVKVLASLVGRLISLQYVFGNVVRMKTRDMYICTITRASWNAPVLVSDAAIREITFWKENISRLNVPGRALNENEICNVLVYCDASAVGYGGYLEMRNVNTSYPEREINTLGTKMLSPDVDSAYLEGSAFRPPELVNASLESGNESLELGITSINKLTCDSPPDVGKGSDLYLVTHSEVLKKEKRVFSDEVTGSWLPDEQSKSSTWREAEAVHRFMRSKAEFLRNKNVKVFSDNKKVKSILLNGSRKTDIHKIALNINGICEKNNIRICPEWIPREINELSDYLSRCHDSDDWSICDSWFGYLDSVWGRHTVDRFSSHFNNHCPRFNSRWWVPGTESIDAFKQDWRNENNWLVPPPKLVIECLNKLEKEQARCTLIAPMWQSAPFWPCLLSNGGSFKHWIREVQKLPKTGLICIGKGNNGVFSSVPMPFNMVALKIRFN